jgi:hypothetical protein
MLSFNTSITSINLSDNMITHSIGSGDGMAPHEQVTTIVATIVATVAAYSIH